MVNVGFFSSGASVVTEPVSVVTDACCEKEKTEIAMADTATNNFRIIVKILSVKEEYGDELLAQRYQVPYSFVIYSYNSASYIDSCNFPLVGTIKVPCRYFSLC